MSELKVHTELLRKILVGFVREEIHKMGVKKAVLGLSGGIDSALVAYIAAEVLGPENVHCIIRDLIRYFWRVLFNRTSCIFRIKLVYFHQDRFSVHISFTNHPGL